MQQRVALKTHAANLDAQWTEECFQDRPGRELVSASSSMVVPGGLEPCKVSVPSVLGGRSQAVSSPVAGVSWVPTARAKGGSWCWTWRTWRVGINPGFPRA